MIDPWVVARWLVGVCGTLLMLLIGMVWHYWRSRDTEIRKLHECLDRRDDEHGEYRERLAATMATMGTTLTQIQERQRAIEATVRHALELSMAHDKKLARLGRQVELGDERC